MNINGVMSMDSDLLATGWRWTHHDAPCPKQYAPPNRALSQLRPCVLRTGRLACFLATLALELALVACSSLRKGFVKQATQRFTSSICCLGGLPYRGQPAFRLATGARRLWYPWQMRWLYNYKGGWLTSMWTVSLARPRGGALKHLFCVDEADSGRLRGQ